jgi:hypothetical protein
MHRAFRRPSLATLLASLLLLANGWQAAAFHWCPMHDGAPARASHAAAASAHEAHGAHGAHAAGAAAEAAPASHGGHENGGGCTCLGDCSQPVSAVLPGIPLRWTLVAPAAVREARIRPSRAHEPAPVEHALPFATAPPAAPPAA